MRKYLIAIPLVALAGIGYLQLGDQGESSTATTPRSETETREVSQHEASPTQPRAAPRRMRATSLPEPVRLQADEDEVRDQRRVQREEQRQQRFAQFDSNGDGELDEEERVALRQARSERRLERNLEFFDSNGDGELDEDERAMRDQARQDLSAERVTRMIGDSDTDKDGLISRTELEAGDRRMRRLLQNFEEVDSDGDEQVSADELQAAMLARRERQGDERQGRGHPVPVPKEGE